MLLAPYSTHDESARQAVLDSLALLDTGPDEVYDRFTRMATAVFDVPIATITLIDRNRQWFKSRKGLDAQEGDRATSFCGHTILGTELFVVDDAADDERFADNPLVTGGPNIRFYAGAPLASMDGHNLGTLCLIDRKPHNFTPEQEEILKDMAASVRELLLVREAAARIRAFLQPGSAEESMHFPPPPQAEMYGGDLGDLDRLLSMIAGRTKAERQLLSAHLGTESRLQTIADNVPGLISHWTRDEVCQFANRPYLDWFGLDPARMLGRTILELFGADRFAQTRPRVNAVLQGKTQRFERTIDRIDGSTGYLQMAYMPELDHAGEVRGFYVMGADITARRAAEEALKEANQRLHTESITDPLTGIYNRRYFDTRSREAMAHYRRLGETFGLLLVDLDHFKQVNDRFGHDGGDRVLTAVGKTLLSTIRAHIEIAARIGGEEFAILCFGTETVEQAGVLAERVRAMIGALEIETEAGLVRPTASIGLTVTRDSDQDWGDILRRADEALYRAKKEGRNRVCAA